MSNTIKKITTAIFISGTMIACGGGGDSTVITNGVKTNPNTGGVVPNNSPGPEYNVKAHELIAQKFIEQATAEGLGFELVKTNTQEKGYVVVKDKAGKFQAYYIDDYTPGKSISLNMKPNYTDLTPGPNNTYSIVSTFKDHNSQVYTSDWMTSANLSWFDVYVEKTSTRKDFYGNVETVKQYTYRIPTAGTLTFSAAGADTKDLQKLQAFQQSIEMQSSIEKIQKNFGVSLKRSIEIAKLAVSAKSSQLSEEDYASLSEQLLGSSVQEVNAAAMKVMRGDSSAEAAVEKIIEKAAVTNGIGLEKAHDLFESMMIK